jgi:hypothetical protein
LEWRGRLRLDVTAGATNEEFALTDVGPFEHSDLGGMLRAADAGSGEFITFLRNLITEDGDQFQPGAMKDTASGRLVEFGFTVPITKSHFQFASADGNAPVRAAYNGSLFAIPQSSDLKRLTLQAENVSDACRVQYATDYRSTRVGDREIIVPQSSTMEVVYANGTELHSETYYSGCRRPGADPVTAVSALAPKPLPPPLPPNVRLHVRFEPAIESETTATGDPVTGVIRSTVKDKQNGIVVRAGDRLHGRIALMEQYMTPQPRWNLAVAFETIERQGVEQPVSLIPMDDGDRLPHDESTSAAVMQRLRPPGGGYFIFYGPEVVLDQKFETEWETH